MQTRHYRLNCLHCAAIYQPHEVSTACPACLDQGALDVIFDYAHIRTTWSKQALKDDRSKHGMWRYDRLLPDVSASSVPPLHVGDTPLYEVHMDMPGKMTLLVKDDSRQPTGSLKDRASALAVAMARDLGVQTMAVASTGNAAAALAGMCASMNMRNVIFLPKSAPAGKLAQLVAYGAEIIQVDGHYDEAFEQCARACAQFGWYNRTTGVNSYMSEGKKTAAFEICEQMNWSVPDLMFVPVGNGCILGAIYKGFYDLLQIGWIDRIPRLIGVQSVQSNYMYRAWKNEGDFSTTERITPSSIATSINVALPRERLKALRAVVDSDGEFICVSDADIVTAAQKLAARTGVFAEAGAAAAFAGAMAYTARHPDTPQTAVVLITGSGLKDTSIFINRRTTDRVAGERKQATVLRPLPTHSE